MAATSTRHRFPVFHPLTVESVQADTERSRIVTFRVPAELEDDFRWLAGQHVTLRQPDTVTASATDVRRSYSICSAPAGSLRVGIKRIDGGLFSEWVLSSLRVGDVVDVMTPSGSFIVDCDATAQRHVVAIAAGSGITPLRAIVEAVLEGEPLSRVTLVSANRSALDAMFLDELAGLKNRFLQRFALWHVLTREASDIDVLSGHVDAERAAELIDKRVVATDAEAYYLCGPTGFIEIVRTALIDHGVPSNRTHVELFTSSTAASVPRAVRAEDAEVTSIASVVLHGRSTTVGVLAGQVVLDATLQVRAEAPYACRSGACSTCRALLRDGTVEMAVNFGLEDDELAAGYILTCQAVPTSDRVVVDFDA